MTCERVMGEQWNAAAGDCRYLSLKQYLLSRLGGSLLN